PRTAVLPDAAECSGQNGRAGQEPLREARLHRAAAQRLHRQQPPLTQVADGALPRRRRQSGGGKPPRDDRRGCRRHAVVPFRPQSYSLASKTRNGARRHDALRVRNVTTEMSSRWLAWSLWPLGMALQASVPTIAGWTRPDTLGRAMGLMTIALLFLLVALEQTLPYRQDWSIRGDRDIWRDLGHAVLYTGIGSTLAQITFLAGLPSVLSRFGFADGLGLWPERSPFLLQVVTVMLV